MNIVSRLHYWCREYERLRDKVGHPERLLVAEEMFKALPQIAALVPPGADGGEKGTAA